MRAKPRATTTVPNDARTARAKGARVLVVEDEQDACDLVSTMLTSRGATVSTATTADEALARLRGQPFDVVVSDIGMPRVDGYQFIEKVRALPSSEGGRTFAVALTAYARSEDRSRALRARFDAHLTKPVDPTALLDVIAGAVRQTAR